MNKGLKQNILLICDKAYSGANKIIVIELGKMPQPALERSLYFALHHYHIFGHTLSIGWLAEPKKCLQTNLLFPEMCWLLPNADLEIATLNFKVQIRHNKFEKAKSESRLNASGFSPCMK